MSEDVISSAELPGSLLYCSGFVCLTLSFLTKVANGLMVSGQDSQGPFLALWPLWIELLHCASASALQINSLRTRPAADQQTSPLTSCPLPLFFCYTSSSYTVSYLLPGDKSSQNIGVYSTCSSLIVSGSRAGSSTVTRVDGHLKDYKIYSLIHVTFITKHQFLVT